MRCGQALCTRAAGFFFVWPGKPKAPICAAHLEIAKGAARALGLEVASLNVEPIDEHKTGNGQ